jgi:hypothetical protein
MAIVKKLYRVQALTELRRLNRQFAGVVINQGTTIEHQLILTTHQVDVHYPHGVVPGLAFQQCLAAGLLANIVRRGIEVDQQSRTGSGCLLCRAVAPDILADRQPHRHTSQFQNTGFVACGEIPLLIKDLIIGWELLAVGGNRFASINDQGCIVKQPAATGRRTDHAGRRQACLVQGVQSLTDPQVQTGTKQQVLRGVAGEAEFRKHNQICVMLLLGLANGINHQTGVTGDIANQKIHLGHDDREFPGSLTRSICSWLLRHAPLL